MVKKVLIVFLYTAQLILSDCFLLGDKCFHVFQTSNYKAGRSTCCSKLQSSTSYSNPKLAHSSTQLKNSLSNGEGYQDTNPECSIGLGPPLDLPEICIIVSKERMLAPGMTSCLHLYDLNNLAAIEAAQSCGGLFSLVRLYSPPAVRSQVREAET